MSKDLLQSCNALPRDPRQLVFIDGDMIDNDFKVALLQLPLATALLGPGSPYSASEFVNSACGIRGIREVSLGLQTFGLILLCHMP